MVLRYECETIMEELPMAYEPGSHNIWAAIAGLKAAVQWLQATSREAIAKHTL